MASLLFRRWKRLSNPSLSYRSANQFKSLSILLLCIYIYILTVKSFRYKLRRTSVGYNIHPAVALCYFTYEDVKMNKLHFLLVVLILHAQYLKYSSIHASGIERVPHYFCIHKAYEHVYLHNILVGFDKLQFKLHAYGSLSFWTNAELVFVSEHTSDIFGLIQKINITNSVFMLIIMSLRLLNNYTNDFPPFRIDFT